MEYLAYALLPLLAIGGVLVYSQMARKKVMGQVDAGFGGQLFHDSQARYFPQLGPRERILAVWNGLAFTQPRSAAGAALNAVSAHVIGVSTYVPMVMVALTTEGRVLVSEEYSQPGVRTAALGQHESWSATALRRCPALRRGQLWAGGVGHPPN